MCSLDDGQQTNDDLLTGHYQKCPVKKDICWEGEGGVSMGFQCFIEFFRHNVLNVSSRFMKQLLINHHLLIYFIPRQYIKEVFHFLHWIKIGKQA